MDDLSVLVLLTGANEGSTPLEAVAHSGAEDIDITVLDFFEASENTHGVDVVSLGASSKYDWRAYRDLYGALRRHQPDVFHVHPNAIGAVARILARFAGIDCIVTTEHNTHAEFGIVRNLVNGGTNWLNDVVVANSVATAESFRAWEQRLLSIAGTKTTVVHYGANVEGIERARTRETVADLPDGFRIVTGGRLADQKNLAVLLRAVALLHEDYPDVRLIVTGDGPKRNELERLAADLGIAEVVTFLGWLPEREDVYTIYHAADLFAYPSHYEGFGVANAEAMATGTPVVVNDIPVLREVVGGAGVFVDATDPRALADAIGSLHDDPERRAALGEASAERIRRELSLSRTVKWYNEVYRECAGE